MDCVKLEGPEAACGAQTGYDPDMG